MVQCFEELLTWTFEVDSLTCTKRVHVNQSYKYVNSTTPKLEPGKSLKNKYHSKASIWRSDYCARQRCRWKVCNQNPMRNPRPILIVQTSTVRARCKDSKIGIQSFKHIGNCKQRHVMFQLWDDLCPPVSTSDDETQSDNFAAINCHTRHSRWDQLNVRHKPEMCPC